MARDAGPRQPTLRFFKVLLPRSLQNLRVPGKVARALGDGEVLVPGALGRVWRIDLRRERRGGSGKEEAFLGRGWAEFARAHGLAVGWFLVFRHEGRRVLSVKAFDTSFCLVEFCIPCPGAALGKNVPAFRRPQFIKIVLPESSKRMRIPPKFARKHMPSEDSNGSQTTTIFSPLGKFWRVELRRDEPHVSLGSGWGEFLTAHGLSRGNLLLFRYEGNMVFTVKAFDPSGCQREYHRDAAAPPASVHGAAEKPPPSSIRRKRDHESAGHAGNKKPECSPASVKKKKEEAHPGARHLLTKELNEWAIEKYFALGRNVCASVGIPQVRLEGVLPGQQGDSRRLVHHPRCGDNAVVCQYQVQHAQLVCNMLLVKMVLVLHSTFKAMWTCCYLLMQ